MPGIPWGIAAGIGQGLTEAQQFNNNATQNQIALAQLRQLMAQQQAAQAFYHSQLGVGAGLPTDEAPAPQAPPPIPTPNLQSGPQPGMQMGPQPGMQPGGQNFMPPSPLQTAGLPMGGPQPTLASIGIPGGGVVPTGAMGGPPPLPPPQSLPPGAFARTQGPPLAPPMGAGPPDAGLSVPVTPSIAPYYQRESGFNYRAQNPKSSASGAGQDIDSTWREALRGLGYSDKQWAHAKDAPPPVQNAANIWLQAKYGGKPWAASEPGKAAARPGADALAKAAAAGRGPPPPGAEDAALAIDNTAPNIDPVQMGRMAMHELAQQIEQANPDAPDLVKAMAFQMGLQYLAPDQRRAWEELKQQHAQEAQLRKQYQHEDYLQKKQQEHDTFLQEQQDREFKEREKLQAEKEKGAGGGLEASKLMEVIDKNGNVARQVMARESRNKAGFIDSQSGEPIKLAPGETLRQITPSTGGGGRAGAQVLRQEIGAREVLSDLQNVTGLPTGTTTGLLGQYTSGGSLMGALQGDLARKLTTSDSLLMRASMANMSRELSILMSPVYGGRWAAEQIDPLIPVEGDPLGVQLFKLARLAQSADNALEGVSKSPVLSNDQQKYAQDMRSQLQQAIPWTPAQAMAFTRGGDTKETFGDFVKRGGLKGGQPAPGAAKPATALGAEPGVPSGENPVFIDTKEDYDALPPNTPFNWNGRVGVKGGGGAVAAPR